MSTADVISTIGVLFILIAFFGLSIKWFDAEDKIYLWLNIMGAGLACWGSWLIPAWPFVVLEAVWASVALITLVRLRNN
ncbi:MAG: hypothetical protein SGI87_09995 [Flavobacteriales bacterium]|nr:hypothetical protein [Flavobacteriales bacterium]